MPYTELYYHLVWRTRASEPLIVAGIESRVHRLIWKKALGMGASVFAVNGTEDHVHVVAAIPAATAVADFVGQVKGYCSRQINREQLTDGHFRWQREYGVFSFDRQRLSDTVAYVENQKRHHADGTIMPTFERTQTEPDDTE